MKIFKEPLLHFLLIGAALFLIFEWRSNSAPVPGGQAGIPPARIVIDRDAVNQMKYQFANTWQRPPTEKEQEGLIEDLVRNEIYYREAVAIGLDREDEVLKRRLRQKMEFIYEDINSLVEPTDDDLVAFMSQRGEKYFMEPQIAFRQIFVSTDKRGDRAGENARQFLARLAAGADPDAVGDATMLEPEVRRSPLRDIRERFGDEFGGNLLDITPGRWAGPIRSAYGLHLVYVTERTGGRLPGLSEVREAVKQDWMAEKQKEMKDAAYAEIRKRYSVTVEKPKAAASSTLSVGVSMGVKAR